MDRYYAEFINGFALAATKIASGDICKKEARFSRDTAERYDSVLDMPQGMRHGFEAALDSATGADV